MDKFKFKQKIKNNSLYKAIMLFMSHLKWHELYVGVLLTSLFINLLGLIFPLMLLQFYDRIIPFKATNTLALFVVIVVVAIVLELILKFLRAMITLWSAARYEHSHGTKVFEALLHRNSKQNDFTPSNIVSRISELFNVKGFYGGQSFALLIDFPFVVIYLFVVWYIGGGIVLIPLVMIVFFILYSFIQSNKLQRSIKVNKKLEEQRFSFTMDMLGGIETVKSYGMESFMQRRHERLQDNSSETDYKINSSSLDNSMLSVYAIQITLVAVISLGAMKIIGGSMTIGSLAACSLLSTRVLAPLARAMRLLKHMQTVVISNDKINELIPDDLSMKSQTKTKANFQGDIELKDLNFKFNNGEQLFDSLKLNVKAKQFISIRGHGSCGKSLLLKMIAGIYSPNNGSVLIDGLNVNEYDVSWLRKRIAYLPQSGTLFKGTILDNLTLFDKANIKSALKWVKICKLEEKINRLPDGYETLVGTSLNQSLPSGFEQLIITIQNLIFDPDIILFDEANHSVDIPTDQKFINLLKSFKGNKTIIVVSDRPSLFKLADVHYEIKDKALNVISNKQVINKVSNKEHNNISLYAPKVSKYKENAKIKNHIVKTRSSVKKEQLAIDEKVIKQKLSNKKLAEKKASQVANTASQIVLQAEKELAQAMKLVKQKQQQVKDSLTMSNKKKSSKSSEVDK